MSASVPPTPRYDLTEHGLIPDEHGDWVSYRDHLTALHDVGLHWCARTGEQDATNAQIRSTWETRLKGELAALNRRHTALLLHFKRATGIDSDTLNLDGPDASDEERRPHGTVVHHL